MKLPPMDCPVPPGSTHPWVSLCQERVREGSAEGCEGVVSQTLVSGPPRAHREYQHGGRGVFTGGLPRVIYMETIEKCAAHTSSQGEIYINYSSSVPPPPSTATYSGDYYIWKIYDFR